MAIKVLFEGVGMTRLAGAILFAALLAVPVHAVWAQDKDDAATAANQPDSRASEPGWTGRTVVPGSHSTIAGNAIATRNQQTGQYGRQR